MNDLPVVGPQTFTLNENASVGTVVGGIIATDVDTGAILTYSIVGGNSSGAFAIDATTGIITVANPGTLDFEIQSTFSLLIAVTDGVGAPQSTTTSIDLLDLNELPTTLNLVGGTVNENSSSGTMVGQLTSTDVDAGDSSTYTLIDDAGGLFAVDPVTGEVTVRGSLDYETATNHIITARITDQGGLTLDRSFVLSVLDLNEAPVLVSGPLSLAENPATGILVGTVLASDVDAGDELQFSLAAGNTSGAFAIDPISGDITVTNPAVLDFEITPSFTLTIQVADRGGLTDQKTLTILLIDLNEQPVILDSDYHIPEWSALGHVVGTAMASDVDAGDRLQYTILSGNTGGRFAIDPVNGQITLADSTAFTYESQSTFLLTVQVTDIAGLTDLAVTTIHVDNVNLPPVALNDRYTMKQFESLAVPTTTGVMANDGDSDSPQINWTILQSPRHGSLNMAADGSFSYIPDNMFFGLETFSYMLSDGFESSAMATVSIEVQMAAPGDTGNSDGNTSDTGSGPVDDDGSTGDQESTTEGNGTGPVAPPSAPPQSTGTPPIRSFTSDILWPAPSNHSAEFETVHSLMEGLFEDKETRSGQRNAISVSDRQSGIPGYAVVMNSLHFTVPPDLAEAVLRNQTLWDGLDTLRDSLNEQHESAVTLENIVVGTTTAVTGSLTVGYVIWLIRGGSLLATMMSVMPTWMSFDPLPVMDRFEEDQVNDDTESLASIVSGRAP